MTNVCLSHRTLAPLQAEINYVLLKMTVSSVLSPNKYLNTAHLASNLTTTITDGPCTKGQMEKKKKVSYKKSASLSFFKS